MNIKTYMAIAVAALTAACSQEPQTVDVPVDENAVAAPAELNADGSVATETPAAEAPAAEAQPLPVAM